MADPDPALLWNYRPTTPSHQPKPAEKLFEFRRPSNGATISCHLRFNGESAGWEVQFIEASGHEFFARGGFMLRELAVRWAERERGAMVSGS